MEKTSWYKTTEYKEEDTKYTKTEREGVIDVNVFANKEDGTMKLITTLRMYEGYDSEEIIEKIKEILKTN